MSRSEEFSPGPFSWEDDEDHARAGFEDGVLVAAGGTLRAANGDSLILTDSGYYPPYGRDRSLFAAAPDLLEAAKEALWLLETVLITGNWSDSPTGDKLRAAIAKAEAIPTPSASE